MSDGIGALSTLLLFATAVVLGVSGALDGYLWALLVIPAAWILTAFDPDVGRWRHVLGGDEQ